LSINAAVPKSALLGTWFGLVPISLLINYSP
jgi:hypothetical protein